MTTHEQEQHNAKAETRAVLATRITIVMALVVGALIMGLELITTLQASATLDTVRDEQKASAVQRKDIQDTADAVESCTTPKGECYRLGQQSTAKAISRIGQLSVYASACAADVDPSLPVRQRVRIIERCVTALVEAPAVP